MEFFLNYKNNLISRYYYQILVDAEPDHSCAITAVTIPKCCAIGHGDHYQIRATRSLQKPARATVEFGPFSEDDTDSFSNDIYEEDARVKRTHNFSYLERKPLTIHIFHTDHRLSARRRNNRQRNRNTERSSVVSTFVWNVRYT